MKIMIWVVVSIIGIALYYLDKNAVNQSMTDDYFIKNISQKIKNDTVSIIGEHDIGFLKLVGFKTGDRYTREVFSYAIFKKDVKLLSYFLIEAFDGSEMTKFSKNIFVGIFKHSVNDSSSKYFIILGNNNDLGKIEIIAQSDQENIIIEPLQTPFMYVCEHPKQDFHFIFYDKNGDIMN